MIYKIGSRGEDVRKIQKALNLIDDGIFGPLTDEAVRDYQRKNNLVVDGIVGDKTFSSLFPYKGQFNRNITEIIIHCSATPEGKDFTVDDIRRWHRDRGFSDVGYHWIIYRDGSTVGGRDESIIGAHCLGHNTHSIGICYIGGLAADGKTPKDTRTDAQKRALKNLLELKKSQYPKAEIHSHRDFAAKACPSFDATTEYSNI